ncbi:fatty acid desaturase [Prosthecobacter vanneervenii]|uniref:Omega-6 fatty acid desaturase (Delta-12 desaturase) n=1 Tax=Prosthecobacter vanneervenii TaxID=48466 RepID=A0A7W7YAT0_9BACT|nr:fatty acid desaturase [Prosthecobacter vanneervenii]MBB5032756.1 omega-6 fatty acid desaturase (delta-12 desaturase) [Prosthecobacter vanneervenii]
MTSAPEMTADKPQMKISEWKKIVAPFQVPSVPRAVWQLVNTFVPMVLLWWAMYESLAVSYWLTLALAAVTGLLVVRVFIFFHDCGHGSFFKSNRANSIVGFICGMVTFTPYAHWSWQHAVHHQTSGDLSRRGDGDIWTMTVKEYQEASPTRRMFYRIIRNPFTLFIVGPLVLFLLYQRIPSPRAKAKDRASVMYMNVAVVLMVVAMSWLFGFKNYVMMQLPVTMFAGMAGIWMFYVQHQYEDVYWEHGKEWDYTTAALEGSSFYKLPKILQWFTGNIGYHHVHHLSSRVPNYYLERCHNSHPMFHSVKPLTILESLKCINLRLWDESDRRLISFKEYRQRYAQKTPVAAAAAEEVDPADLPAPSEAGPGLS